MDKKITSLLLLTLFFYFPLVYAIDFTLSDVSVKTPADYETGTATLKITITSTSQACSQTCQLTSPDDSKSFTLVANAYYGAEFKSNAIPGQHTVSGEVNIYCDGDGLFCIGKGGTSKSFQHSYPYKGDGSCLTSYEDCTSTKSDCPCTTTGTKCINELDSGKWLGRTPDSRKCVTSCGNGIKESSFESCSNCPADAGKCDGISCISGSECEGKYCVHEKCWNKSYKEGDGFCDTNSGENSKNSLIDCACKKDQRPSSSGGCETFCGNSICESNENCLACSVDCGCNVGFACSNKGTCEKSVKCGDSVCDIEESCSTCPADCGSCPKPVSTTETTSSGSAQQQSSQKSSTSSTTQQESDQPDITLTTSHNNQKNTILIVSIMVLIGAGLIIYGIKKIKWHGKSHKKDEGKHRLKHCTRCGFKINSDDLYCEKCGKKSK